jgi:hypothetical protein
MGRIMTRASTPATAPSGTTVTRDAVTDLIARWRHDGVTFAVLDERGRHRAELAEGRLDLTHASVTDARWVEATLHRTGYVLFDACNVARSARPPVLGRALTALQRLRARTGQPEWVLIEDAQDVLSDPAIPPHAIRLADGGYCLAVRDGGTLPASATRGAAFDVRMSRPGLELSLIPRSRLRRGG